MPEAEVLYSDVKFKRDKGNNDGSASSAADTTYSAVRILEKQPELPEQDTDTNTATTQTQSDSWSGLWAGLLQTVEVFFNFPTCSDCSQQQSESALPCKVTSERAAVIVLSVLLAASLITLRVTSHQNIQTIERLQKMMDECDAEIKNLTGGSCKRCPDGWEPHGGKCYYFSINEATWTRSRAECRRTGGDLVKIESTEEQEFLEQKVRGEMTEGEDKFWIGLTDSETEGTWLWTDGSPLDSGLTFWFKGEPDNFKGIDTMGEDCARMGERGGATGLKCWFDKSCEDPHKSICEKPEDPNSLRI